MTKLQEERREGAKDRAERLAALADHQAEQAMSEVKHLPLGQPVLVGHHSEKWLRRGKAEILRDLLHHLNTLQKERPPDRTSGSLEPLSHQKARPGSGGPEDPTTQGDPG